MSAFKILESTAMIRGRSRTGDESYWRQVLRYYLDGSLRSVLDRCDRTPKMSNLGTFSDLRLTELVLESDLRSLALARESTSVSRSQNHARQAGQEQTGSQANVEAIERCRRFPVRDDA